MKRILSAILVIMLIAQVSLSTYAMDTNYFEVNGVVYKILFMNWNPQTREVDLGNVSIFQIKDSAIDDSGMLNLPSEVASDGNIYTVTIIDSNVIDSCSKKDKILEIKFPENINHIGDYAFSNCISIKSIYIPSRVRTMGNNVFSGCTSLREVYFGSKMQPSEIRDIGTNCFLNTYKAWYDFIYNPSKIYFYGISCLYIETLDKGWNPNNMKVIFIF